MRNAKTSFQFKCIPFNWNMWWQPSPSHGDLIKYVVNRVCPGPHSPPFSLSFETTVIFKYTRDILSKAVEWWLCIKMRHFHCRQIIFHSLRLCGIKAMAFVLIPFISLHFKCDEMKSHFTECNDTTRNRRFWQLFFLARRPRSDGFKSHDCGRARRAANIHAN